MCVNILFGCWENWRNTRKKKNKKSSPIKPEDTLMIELSVCDFFFGIWWWWRWILFIFSQVTGGDSEGSDKARIEGSAEAAFARRRCSCSGFHRNFRADCLSGIPSLAKLVFFWILVLWACELSNCLKNALQVFVELLIRER